MTVVRQRTKVELRWQVRLLGGKAPCFREVSTHFVRGSSTMVNHRAKTADSRFAARHAQEGIPDGASGQSGFVERCFDASRTSCREATESYCDVA